VQETSDTQIKCRMATDYNRIAATQGAPLIVFASTFEEATFANGLSSTFTFVGESSLPTIDPVLVKTWDATDLTYLLTINGSDYDSADTISTADVFIGGIKQ
jgi:hypothetical protein